LNKLNIVTTAVVWMGSWKVLRYQLHKVFKNNESFRFPFDFSLIISWITKTAN
jgi:hypothetical protein